MRDTDMIQKLPIIDMQKDPFMDLNTDLSNDTLKEMIGHNIIYRQATPNGVMESTGVLVNQDNDSLIIHHDSIEDVVPITSIKAIEVYSTNNPLNISPSYIGCICKITNIHNDSMICLITNIAEDEIEFEFKVIEEDKEVILTGYYLKHLIKSIIKL